VKLDAAVHDPDAAREARGGSWAAAPREAAIRARLRGEFSRHSPCTAARRFDLPLLPEFPMFRNVLLVALATVCSAALASAQTVTVRGVVEDQGATFVLDNTPLTLNGNGVNLNAFLGLEVEAVGTVTAPDHLTVTSAVAVNDVFEVGGGGLEAGKPAKLEVTGPPGRIEQIHFSLGNDFTVVKKMGWFLDGNAQLLAQGVIPATGVLEITLPVPNNPALVGIKVFFQDIRKTGSAPFKLGNADASTIAP
jgi:hypothetical protein